MLLIALLNKIQSAIPVPKSNHVDVFIAYNCRFVTCDYSKWSAWSATCGTGMRRARDLVKVNEHYIKKQGGCSGLKVTCDRQETETRTTTNCKFNMCIGIPIVAC